MRTRLRRVAALAACLVWAQPASAGPTDTPTCTLPHPALARGFSLTGWFDEPVARPPDPATLKTLRARGMLHVRLPIAAESVMTRFSPPDAIEAQRRRIGVGVDTLLVLGYAVIVDLHGGERLADLFRRDPNAARDAVIQAWTVLGPLVEARAPRGVMAEVLNEPPLDDAAWATMQREIVASLRRVAPTATLVVSTGGPQRVERLTAATPIDDPATVYAVHYYDPMVFTHQGADWLAPDPIAALGGVPFPIRRTDPRLAALAGPLRARGATAAADYVASLADRSFGVEDVARHMGALAAWSRANRRPVVIGEFGVYRGAARPDERRAWLAAVAGAAEAACVGWTHWEFRDGFGFVDANTGRIDEATLSSLLGRGSSDADERVAPRRP